MNKTSNPASLPQPLQHPQKRPCHHAGIPIATPSTASFSHLKRIPRKLPYPLLLPFSSPSHPGTPYHHYKNHNRRNHPRLTNASPSYSTTPKQQPSSFYITHPAPQYLTSPTSDNHITSITVPPMAASQSHFPGKVCPPFSSPRSSKTRFAYGPLADWTVHASGQSVSHPPISNSQLALDLMLCYTQQLLEMRF